MNVPPEELTESPAGKRWIIGLIALGTLITALVGYWQTEAGAQEETYEERARNLSIKAMARRELALERALGQVLERAQAAGYDIQAAHARRQSYLLAPTDPRRRRLILMERRWRRLARRIRNQSALEPTSPESPARDPAFPNVLLEEALKESERIWAQQDALRESSEARGKDVIGYTLSLTILGLGLYLLALSLVEGRLLPWRGLAIAGGAFLSVGFVVALSHLPGQDPPAPPSAAKAFAEGVVALRKGSVSLDQTALQKAQTKLSQAIDERPSFAQAYELLAVARFLAHSPQEEGYFSLTQRKVLPQVIDDLETAEEQGRRTFGVYARLGFYYFLQALLGNEPGLLEPSVETTRKALQLRRDEPVSRLNLGVALLASGRKSDALMEYEEAVEDTTDPYILAGAVTDLEILGEQNPSLASDIAKLKESIVRQFWEPRSIGSRTRNVTMVRPAVSPAEIGVIARVDKFEPKSDVLVVQWYKADKDTGVWSVLPEVSGEVTGLPSKQIRDVVTHRISYVTRTEETTQSARCLAPGRYRVEIYLNGQLQAERQITPSFLPLEATISRHLAIGFCRPESWRESARSVRGFSTIYSSPNGQSGAAVLRYLDPGPAKESDLVRNMLRTSQILRTDQTERLLDTHSRELGHRLTSFMRLPRAVIRRYGDNEREILIAAGESNDGDVIVGLVYGPCIDQRLEQVFKSFGELYPLRTERARSRLPDFKSKIVEGAPKSWVLDSQESRKNSFTLLERERRANIIGSTEYVVAGFDARDYAIAEGIRLRVLPGYEQLSLRPVTVRNGGEGYIRHYRWERKEERFDQHQLYYVENRRAYVFTTTSLSHDSPRRRARLRHLLGQLLRPTLAKADGC